LKKHKKKLEVSRFLPYSLAMSTTSSPATSATPLLAIPASLTRVIHLEECLAFLGSVADPLEDTSVEAQAIEELIFIMDLIRDAFRIQEDLPRSIRSILRKEPTWGWIETILAIQGIDADEIPDIEEDGWVNGRPIL
jgi:hypothetical protein